MKKIMALVMTMALTGAIFAGLSDVTVQGTAPRERACPHNKQELTVEAAETAEEAIEETVPAEQTNEITEDVVEVAPVEEVVEEVAPIVEIEVAEGAPLAENIEIEESCFDEIPDPHTLAPSNWNGLLGNNGVAWAEEALVFNRGEAERTHWVYDGYKYLALSNAEYNEVKAIRNKIVTVDPNYVINNAKYDKQGNWVSNTGSAANWK